MTDPCPPASDGAARPIGMIGGIGLTEVRVYAQRPAPADGTFSGCPHVHAVTDEGYFVLQGAGAVEFHDRRHGYRKLALVPGQYLRFPPLIVHRLISDGDLVILGIMGNAGLAERGEARIYFGPQIDTDPARFEALVNLARQSGLEGALQRRDSAVAGYQHLMRLWRDDRRGYFAELERFIAMHCRAMGQITDQLAEQVERGPVAHARATAARIASLPDIPSLDADDDVVVSAGGSGPQPLLGMCGILRPIVSLRQLAHLTP
jgi:mannose-6-phosphate isomerase-like protein (cupin superfamily)